MSIDGNQLEKKISQESRLAFFLENYELILKNVEEAVAGKDLEKLREIGYRYLNLMAGTFFHNYRLQVDIQYDLYPTFACKNVKALEENFKKCLEKLKKEAEEYLKRLQDKPKVDSVAPSIRPTYWLQNEGMQPTQMVRIIHGGGLRYILAWLTEEEEGYRLEENREEVVRISAGKGIQVHPFTTQDPYENILERVFDYATDRSAKSLDYPAYLCAEIEAQYLDSAPNKYEAGIRSGFQNQLKNKKIHLVLGNHPLTPVSFSPPKARLEFSQIPTALLFETFKVTGSSEFLEEAERVDKAERGAVKNRPAITYFFDAFKKAKAWAEIESVCSTIQEYAADEPERPLVVKP